MKNANGINMEKEWLEGGGAEQDRKEFEERRAKEEEGARAAIEASKEKAKTKFGENKGVVASDSSPDSNGGSVLPIDLSVNFLHVIDKAPGAPPEPIMASSASSHRSPEDFLPIVTPKQIQFRWRHEAKALADEKDLTVTAYQVLVQTTKGDNVWDSGKRLVNEEAGVRIKHVSWEGAAPAVGQILQWSVTLWDGAGKDSASTWSKFGVGPEEGDWKGKWMTHPSDMDMFDKTKTRWSFAKHDDCKGWQLRRPLPLFRTKIPIEKKSNIVSALLLVSGLGSFRASVNGVPLSTSGPIDPPFTDYSKRVMYRGFDVTPFTQDAEMVIGMTMGSGWWDHRPVSGMAKPQLLPRGPQTIVAQVVITYGDGDVVVVGETSEKSGWQVTRGHIRESDLFTGEMVDLDVLAKMEGWDTVNGWAEASDLTEIEDPFIEINKWVAPVPYRTDVTLEQRVQTMSIRAKAMKSNEGKFFKPGDNFADPVGKLVPHEIPPVMPIEVRS